MEENFISILINTIKFNMKSCEFYFNYAKEMDNIEAKLYNGGKINAYKDVLRIINDYYKLCPHCRDYHEKGIAEQL